MTPQDIEELGLIRMSGTPTILTIPSEGGGASDPMGKRERTVEIPN
jgi:hypothetical protein